MANVYKGFIWLPKSFYLCKERYDFKASKNRSLIILNLLKLNIFKNVEQNYFLT